VPIGNGLGIEGLVAQIKPLFTKESALVRWVALRGALADLYIQTVDPSSAGAPFYPVVEVAMGVGHVSDPDTDDRWSEHLDVGPAWVSRVSQEQREAAIGLLSAVARRLFDYERFSKMNVQDVNADAMCQLDDAMALDYIAWTAVASLRLGWASEQMEAAAEPDELTVPGWYTEPLFAKSERYWDGTDWTERCRVAEGRNYLEVVVPLRP